MPNPNRYLNRVKYEAYCRKVVFWIIFRVLIMRRWGQMDWEGSGKREKEVNTSKMRTNEACKVAVQLAVARSFRWLNLKNCSTNGNKCTVRIPACAHNQQIRFKDVPYKYSEKIRIYSLDLFRWSRARELSQWFFFASGWIFEKCGKVCMRGNFGRGVGGFVNQFQFTRG